MYILYYFCTNSKTNQAQINLIVNFLSDSIVKSYSVPEINKTFSTKRDCEIDHY